MKKGKWYLGEQRKESESNKMDFPSLRMLL